MAPPDDLRKEIHGSADDLRKEIHGSADDLRKNFTDTTDDLRKNFADTTESLIESIAEIRGYFRGFIIASVPVSLGILALLVHVIVRG